MKTPTKAIARRGNIKVNPALDGQETPKAFLEKAERAKAFLAKHPLPEHLIKRG